MQLFSIEQQLAKATPCTLGTRSLSFHFEKTTALMSRPKRNQRSNARLRDLEDSDADEEIQRASKRRLSKGKI